MYTQTAFNTPLRRSTAQQVFSLQNSPKKSQSKSRQKLMLAKNCSKNKSQSKKGITVSIKPMPKQPLKIIQINPQTLRVHKKNP